VNLTRKLGELFDFNMQKDLPKIYKEINEMIETKEKEQSKLGSAFPIDEIERLMFIL
jgi:hypothetical protein